MFFKINMATIDSIKNLLINRIRAARNEKFLEAIERILVTTQRKEELVLYLEQKEMLLMSELDIENGNLVSEYELDNYDSFYMNK